MSCNPSCFNHDVSCLIIRHVLWKEFYAKLSGIKKNERGGRGKRGLNSKIKKNARGGGGKIYLNGKIEKNGRGREGWRGI